MDCPNCTQTLRLRADYAEHLRHCLAWLSSAARDLRHYVAIPVRDPRRTTLEPRRELSAAGTAPEQP